MKIAIITRHAIANYGSLLQTIATQQVLEDLGHQPEIIDYIRSDESPLNLERTLLRHKPEWEKNIVKRIAYLGLRIPESLFIGRRFESFRNEHLRLSKRYTSVEQLEVEPPEADLYMTGSDQVWGPTASGNLDRAYCLSFVKGKKKTAYAASFGHVNFSAQQRKYFQRWLPDYQYITVREDSAVDFLNRIGIPCKQVLDPTLLLNKETWNRFLQPVPTSKYILVYQLHKNQRLGEYAQKVAQATGLPLLRVSTALHQINQSGKLIWSPNLNEFLSYIKNASCLITDSFHGTVFALIYHTPFVEVLPENNTGTRNLSILKMTNLEDRILRDPNNLLLAEEAVDFTKADHMIEQNRLESMKALQAMLNNQ